MPRYDVHVHLVGNGLSGSGCWLRPPNAWRRAFAEVLRRSLGLPARLDAPEFDAAYVDMLRGLVRGSGLELAVLLAQEEVYADDGRKLDFGSFHVPNDYLLDVCRRHPEFVPGVAIHPARADALEELERCLQGGARLLKLLPNCQNVDCSLRRYDRFWERLAEAKLPFLAHTGGELTVPVLRRDLQDPRCLRRPLEIGVTVIAAHAASASYPGDADYYGVLIDLMQEFPHLYADTSALNTPARSAAFERILASPYRHRFLHGSDYPVATGARWAWWRGLVTTAEARTATAMANPLARDRYLKEAMGFEPEHFTRVERLLRPA